MIKIFLNFAIGLLVLTGPLYAQTNCGEREAVVDRLVNGYGEEKRTIGLSSKNTVIEIYANLVTGTWTALQTHTSGRSCVVSSGTDYYETRLDSAPEGDRL